MKLDDMRAAGFSEDEISAYVQKRRADYLSAGFSNDEIDAHFGIASRKDSKPFLPSQERPEPAPFDPTPHFSQEIAKRPPEEHENLWSGLTRMVYPYVRPYVAIGCSAAVGVNRGLAGFSANLDALSDYVADKTGLQKGGLFEDAARIYEENADFWKKRAEDAGANFIEELIGEAAGGAVPGVAEFALNIPYAAAVGAADAAKRGESELAGALLEGAKRGTLGIMFRALTPLKQYLRAPAMGGIFAGQAAMEGAPSQEIAKAGGTGLLYSLTSPGGQMGLKEIGEGFRKESARYEREKALEPEPPKVETKPTEEGPKKAPEVQPTPGPTAPGAPTGAAQAVAEETAPTSIVVKEKTHLKNIIRDRIDTGQIPEGDAVRFTDVGYLRSLMGQKALPEGTSFEGKAGISAFEVSKERKALVAYGDNTKHPVAIRIPKEYILGPGESTNEVLIDPATPTDRLEVFIDGDEKAYTWPELEKLFTERPEVPVEVERERLRPYLEMMVGQVEAGQAGGRIVGPQELVTWGSAFPDFMKNQGWTGAKVINAINKFLEGKKLGAEQERIIDRALDEARSLRNRFPEWEEAAPVEENPPDWVMEGEAIEAQIGPLYHGTGKKFDKFSTAHVGEGQGAQSFGWGLYFTDAKEIAESYATPPGVYDFQISIDKGPFKRWTNKWFTDVKKEWDQDVSNNEKRAMYEIMANYGDAEAAYRQNTRRGFNPEVGQIIRDWIDSGKIQWEEIKPKGNIHTVTLHRGKTPDQYDYLRWDEEPTGKQWEKITTELGKDSRTEDLAKAITIFNRLDEIAGKPAREHITKPELTKEHDNLRYQLTQLGQSSVEIARKLAYYGKGTESFYYRLGEILGSDKDASLFLLRAGIDGIKYPAGTLGGKPAGAKDAFNYVVFDDRVISMGGPEEMAGEGVEAMAAVGQKPKVAGVAEGIPLEKPMSRSEIIKYLEKNLNIPIRVGRFRVPGALGIFKGHGEVIRLKEANDIEVAAHEVGHDIQKFLWPKSFARNTGLTGDPFHGYKSELEPIATMPKPGGDKTPEGFAEFVRRYVTDPADAINKAPRFYKFFEDLLDRKAPEIKQILLESRDMWDKWKKQPPLQRILGQISIGEKARRPINFRELYTWTLDKFHPLEVIRREMTTEKLAASDDFYKLARLLAGWTGKAETFLYDKPFSFLTYRPIGVKSLREILLPVKDDLDEFRAYMVAERTIEKKKQNIDTGILIEDAETVAKQYRGRFGASFADLKKYQDACLAYLRGSGIIGEADWEAIKAMNEDYAPLYRVMDEEGRIKGGMGSGLEAWSPVRRMKGSQRDIIDPLESIIKNTYLFINLAEKNAVGRSLVSLAEKKEGLGRYIDPIPTPLQKIQVWKDELTGIFKKYGEWIESEKRTVKEWKAEKVSEEGGEEGPKKWATGKIEEKVREALKARGWSEGETSQFIERLRGAPTAEARAKLIERIVERTIVIEKLKEFGLDLPEGGAAIYRTSGFVPKENVISVWIDGERKLYQVHPEIARAFQALDQESVGLLTKILAAPARALRAGVTIVPEFAAKNIARDQLTAFITSKYGYIPVFDLVRGIFHAAKRDDLYWEWKKAGGDHAMVVSLDRGYLQDNLGKLLQEHPAVNVLKHPWQGLRMLSEFSEAGTRLGEFSRAYQKELKAGKGEKEAAQEAGYESREVTIDFARMGAKTRALSATVAFWNPSVQGIDRMMRAAKDDPAGFGIRVAISLVLPSVLVAIATHKDETMKEIPQWQKDLYWVIPRGENQEPFRIPKPFEPGILFGTTAERITHYILDQDPHAFDHLAESLGRAASPGYIPTSALPFLELWANKSMFFDRPIVPEDKEELLPEYQYGPYTTETAKALGKILGKLPLVPETGLASPAKIDHLVQGWTGGAGKYVLDLLSQGMESAGISRKETGPEPLAKLTDMPVIKAFFVRYPSTNAESISDFYDNYQKAEAIYKTFHELTEKQGRPQEALEMLDRMGGDLVRLNDFQESLSNIRRAVELVRDNPAMSADEKRETMDILMLQMVQISRAGNQLYEDVKAAEKNVPVR